MGACTNYVTTVLKLIYKHFYILPNYLALAVRRESEYKAGFYTFIFHQIIAISIWLIFWKAIINNIGDNGKLGDWDYGRMVMLTGFVSINMGMWALFSTIWRLPRQILTGELNNHLIKPVHPFLHMVFKRLNLRATPRIFIGIGVLTLGSINSQASHPPSAVCLAALISMLSFLTTIMPFAIVCLAAFWIGKAEFLRDLFIELFLFQNYPLSEFPKPFIVVFTIVIPMIFAATTPVLVLTQWDVATSLTALGAMILIIVTQLLLFKFLWNRGLRRYESYGG